MTTHIKVKLTKGGKTERNEPSKCECESETQKPVGSIVAPRVSQGSRIGPDQVYSWVSSWALIGQPTCKSQWQTKFPSPWGALPFANHSQGQNKQNTTGKKGKNKMKSHRNRTRSPLTALEWITFFFFFFEGLRLRVEFLIA